MTTTTVSPSISIQQMKEIARNMRIDIIKMIGAAGSGHPGGSLSEVELMVALYFKVMHHDPKDPSGMGAIASSFLKVTAARLCIQCWRKPATSITRC